MNLQPQLECSEYLLRPLKETDFDALYAASNDPDIWRQHPNKNRHLPDQFEKYFKQSLDSKGCLVLIDKSTQQIIGSSRYYDLKLDDYEVAIGYTFLQCKYWGSAANFKMKKMMTDHAFKSVDNIVFHIWKENLRSQAASKKIGAEFLTDTIRKGPNNEDLDYVIYSLNKRHRL